LPNKLNSSKFCILGANFHTGNLGVNALAYGAIKGILKASPSANICILDYGKFSTPLNVNIVEKVLSVKLINIRFSKKFYLKNNIAFLLLLATLIKFSPSKSLNNFIFNRNTTIKDLIQIDTYFSLCGGDSFSDLYGLKRFIYIILPQFLVILLGKDIFQLPQTFGPFNTKTSKYLSKYIFNNSKTIFARDKASLSIVRSSISDKTPPTEIKFSHDLGFSLDPKSPSDKFLLDFKKSLLSDEIIIGFNVSGLLYIGGYTKNNMFNLSNNYIGLVDDILHCFLQIDQVRVILIPHVYGGPENSESDYSVCKNLFKKFNILYPDKITFFNKHYDHREIKHIIGLSNFFLGSRMHACIAAASQNITTVAISYSDKFKGVFDSIDSGYLVVDLRVQENSEIIKRIQDIYSNREIFSKKLQSIMPIISENSISIFQDIIT